MSRDRGKASWDMNTTKVFIDLCLKQLNAGRRMGSSFTRPGWAEIISDFTEQTHRVYSRIQLKNKYDSLRKEYQLWDRLLKETGVGWDVDRNTVRAPDDWWEKKILEVPAYEKFRLRGLHFQNELLQLFGSVAATGANQWAPSSSVPPPQPVPTVDSEEGSGDSHQVEGATTGVSAGLQYVNVNDFSGGSAGRRTSTGDRANIGARSTASLGVSRGDPMKKKGAAAKQMAEAMRLMAEETRLDRLERKERTAKKEEASIGAVLSHLDTVEEVVADRAFFLRCIDVLVKDQSAREAYVAWKNSKEKLLVYLRHLCYGDNI